MTPYVVIETVFLLYACESILALQEDYYWREYTGTIPQDAIIGGQDINHEEIYIGQAYVKDKGLIVVAIHQGSKDVVAPIYGAKKINSNIKILCGLQQNFYWTSVNSTDLHLFLIDKHAVIGGHEDGGGMLNIGRTTLEGGIKIGKVLSFNPKKASLFYTHRDKEISVQSYEILLFRNNSVDVRFTHR